MLDDLDIIEVVQALFCEALLLVDVASAVRGGDRDCSQLQQLLNGVDGHISSARHSNSFPLDRQRQASDKWKTSLANMLPFEFAYMSSDLSRG